MRNFYNYNLSVETTFFIHEERVKIEMFGLECSHLSACNVWHFSVYDNEVLSYIESEGTPRASRWEKYQLSCSKLFHQLRIETRPLVHQERRALYLYLIHLITIFGCDLLRVWVEYFGFFCFANAVEGVETAWRHGRVEDLKWLCDRISCFGTGHIRAHTVRHTHGEQAAVAPSSPTPYGLRN